MEFSHPNGLLKQTAKLCNHTVPQERMVMKTDRELQQDVIAELNWDPAVRVQSVGVTVDGGVVTLTGHLASYSEKAAVEKAVQRVRGVKGIAVALNVKLAESFARDDAELAAIVERTLRWNVRVPEGMIYVVVEHGRVTLGGTVEWAYQRQAAERSVRDIRGVIDVSNVIEVAPGGDQIDVVQSIREAIGRHAGETANDLDIRFDGATVTLRGTVRTLAERGAAQGAAWSAPGVITVVNHLSVQP